MCQNILQGKNMPYSKDFYQLPKNPRHTFNEFLREQPAEKHIFMDIKSTLIILKATGVLPIFKQVSQFEIAPPASPSEYYSFFIRSVVHVITLFHFYNIFTQDSKQLGLSYRDTDNINHWIEIILSIITYTTTVFICGRNGPNFLKIINEILEVDKEIHNQCQTILENKCEFSVKFLVCIFICQAYITGLKIVAQYNYLTPTSYIIIGFYTIQNGVSMIFIVFASSLLRIIKMRFAFLNLILNGFTYKTQQNASRQKRLLDKFRAMEKFPEDSLFTFRMHNKMLHIYKFTNDCCSLIFVSYMGYAFYTITTNTYNLFVQITKGHDISAQVIQFGFTWLILHTSLLTLLSRSCGQTSMEANTTSQILARVYGKNKENQNILPDLTFINLPVAPLLVVPVDKFLTKSIKQEVQFTAYGFFIIDDATLFKIFSAVTTYLVILIQFKQLEDSKNEENIVSKA